MGLSAGLCGTPRTFEMTLPPGLTRLHEDRCVSAYDGWRASAPAAEASEAEWARCEDAGRVRSDSMSAGDEA